jgi:hypothetical protein
LHKNQYDEIKKIITEKDQNIGIVLPGKQRWSLSSPEELANRFPEQNESDQVVIWNAVYLTTQLVKCSNYSHASNSVTGSCIANEYGFNTTISGCKGHNWGISTLCMYGDNPSTWLDANGVDVASGYAYNENYLFGTVDLLRNSEDLSYKTVSGINGNFLDTNISKDTRIRYSIDVLKDSPGTISFKVKTYGRSFWEVYLDDDVVDRASSVNAQTSQGVCYLTSGSWHTISIKYLALDEDSGLNRIEFSGDLFKQIDRYRTVAPVDAPTILTVSDEEYHNMIQVDWQNGYFGAGAFTAIYASGSSVQDAQLDEWTMLDIVPIGITTYSDTDLLDGEERYYLLRHISSDGDLSPYSNVLSGQTISYIQPRLATIRVVADGDETRDSSQRTGCFSNSDSIYIYVKSPVPLDSYPNVWIRVPISELAGTYSDILTTPADTFDTFYTETVHGISLGSFTSDNDGKCFVIISGTSYASAEHWNLTNMKRFFSLDVLMDAPNSSFILDNLAPTAADSLSIPDIELYTGETYTEDGSVLAGSKDLIIKPSRDSDGRANVIDNESKCSVNHSDLYQARFLISGAGLSIPEGGSQDWSAWETYSEGGTKLISLPDLIDSTSVNYSTVYIWAQFRDRALNTCNPVWATLEVDTSPPLPPTGLSAEGGMNIITINWDRNEENDIKHYRIYGSDTNNPQPYLSYTGLGDEYPKIATSNFYIDSVPGDTRRYYQIVAVDTSMNTSIGNGTHPVVSGITVDTVPPSAPTGLVVSSWSVLHSDTLIQDSFIGATWNNNTEDDMDGYYLQYEALNGKGWQSVETDYFSSALVVSGAFSSVAGLSYNLRVKAFDTLRNTSDPSSTVSIIASGDITPPQALDYFVLSGGTDMTPEGYVISEARCYMSANNSDADLNHFDCEITVSGQNSWTRKEVFATDPTSIYQCTFDGLFSETDYLIRARAVDHVGNEGPFTSGSVRGGRDLVGPEPPENIFISPLLESLSLRWTPSVSIDTVDYVIIRGESDEEVITDGTLTNDVAQGAYTAVLTLSSRPDLYTGYLLSIDPHGTNEDNVLIVDFDGDTDTVTVQTPFKLSHSAGATFKIYYTRAIVGGTSMVDSATSIEYYNIAARDVSGNVGDLALAAGSWIYETPATEASTTIPYDFLSDISTINLLKNSSFEIGSGTINANMRDIFWDDWRISSTWPKTVASTLRKFGDYCAQVISGGEYAQLIRVSPNTDYVFSAYIRAGSSPWANQQFTVDVYYSQDPSNLTYSYITANSIFPDWSMTSSVDLSDLYWHRVYIAEEDINLLRTSATDTWARVVVRSNDDNGITGRMYLDGLMFQEGTQITNYIPYSNEFVLGTECITSVEITSGTIIAPNIAANAIESKHILAGQIGTHHLTVMGKPYYFSFDIHPNTYWIDTPGGEEEYNHLGLIWSGGSVILCSGAGATGDTATNVWVEQTVPSGGQILTADKTYYLYFDYQTYGVGNFKYEPVNGGTTTIGITDNIGQTVNLSTLNRRLFGRLKTYSTVRDMEFMTIGAGTIIDGDSIRTGSLQARAIMAGTITGNEIHGETITGDKLVANTLMGDTIISAINESAEVIDAENLPAGLRDTTAPSWASFYFTCSGTTAGTVNMWWNPASDASGVKGYRIWRALGSYTGWSGSPAEIVAELEPASIYDNYWGNSVAFIDTGATSGQTYTYFLSAYDAYGNESTPVPRINATKWITVTDTAGPTSVPSFSKLYPGNGRLTLEWTEPTLSSNTDIVQYKVTWASDGSTFSTLGFCRDTKFIHFLNSDYAWSSIYHANWVYRIYSVDKYGNLSSSYLQVFGTSSTTQSGAANSTGIDYIPCDGIKPSAPTSLTAIAGTNADIALSWPRSASTDVEGYRLYVWEQNNSTITRSFCYTIRSLYSEASTISYMLTGLIPKAGYPPDFSANNYRYTISGFAYDAQGNLSVASSTFRANLVYATDSTGPTPVTGIALTYIPFGVKIAWTGSSATDVDKYVIKVRTYGTTGVADGNYPSWTSNFDRQIIVDANQMGASASYSVYDMGLQNCTTTNYGYSYSIYAVDYYGNVDTTMTHAASQDWIKFDSTVAFGTDIPYNWATNHTYINGGQIYTGTVTADKIQVMHRAFDTNIRFELNSTSTSITPLCEATQANSFVFPADGAIITPIANIGSILALTSNDVNYIVLKISNKTFYVYTYSSYIALDKTDHITIGTVDTRSSPASVVLAINPGTTIDGSVITTGYIDADRIEARSITVDKISVTNAKYETNARLYVFLPVPTTVRAFFMNDTNPSDTSDTSNLYLRILGRTTNETVTIWPMSSSSFIKKPNGTNYSITGIGNEYAYIIFSGGGYGGRFYIYSPAEYTNIINENASCYLHFATLEYREGVLRNTITNKGTFIDGDSIRTGTLDVSRTVAVNSDTEHPIYVGKVTADVGGNSGITILGDWTQQTPGSITVPAGRGLVVAHSNSYTRLDSNGLRLYNHTGSEYTPYKKFMHQAVMAFPDFPAPVGGSAPAYGTYIPDTTLYTLCYMPSGADTYDHPNGYIAAPKFIIDELQSIYSSGKLDQNVFVSPFGTRYLAPNPNRSILTTTGFVHSGSNYHYYGIVRFEYTDRQEIVDIGAYGTYADSILRCGPTSNEGFRVRVNSYIKYNGVSGLYVWNGSSSAQWVTGTVSDIIIPSTIEVGSMYGINMQVLL